MEKNVVVVNRQKRGVGSLAEDPDRARVGLPAKLQTYVGRVISYVILGGWTLFVVFAVGWLVLASLSTTRGIFTNDLLSTGLHWENYVKALTTQKLGLYFFNSVLYVSGALVLIIAISAPAAYVLSRFNFPGRQFIQTLFISGMGIPQMMIVIPLFILFIKLSMVGTLQGLVLVYVCTSIPFTVYFLTGFFSTLPKEMEEAAKIDGCTDMEAFWKIMLPLAQPGIVTVTVFNFIGLWNDYFWALIFVNSPERRTLALGLEFLVQSMRYTGDWAGLFASVIVVFLPTFVLYLFLSEKVIAGITAGAVK